ncbi:MAG: DNA methyltransferase [Nitrososphaera sp.]
MVVDESWSFKDATRTETLYITHGYHRYPAKFIPQLAARVIKENSQAGDLICDPFMGSGTTLVEAIVNGRKAYGTDINPVAVLIATAKTTVIEPLKLKHETDSLLGYLEAALFQKEKGQSLLVDDLVDFSMPSHERIDYWFPQRQKHDLALILSTIRQIRDKEIQTFLLCSFSNILKGCSRWMMKSVKPTRDKEKVVADAHRSFILQMRRMMKKNEELWKLLDGKKVPRVVIDNCDARELGLKDNEATLIVTSPPYITSYEYADLHQLTALWLGYTDNLKDFRRKFIGSIQKEDGELPLYSPLAKETIGKLRGKDKREATGAERYFFEMQQCFEEMHRVLKPRGRAAIVIGDTDLKKVKIKNAEIFIQTMEKVGFKTYDVIKRPIPGKILPLTRDEKTGKFARTADADRLAYPTEYIVIMEKT